MDRMNMVAALLISATLLIISALAGLSFYHSMESSINAVLPLAVICGLCGVLVFTVFISLIKTTLGTWLFVSWVDLLVMFVLKPRAMVRFWKAFGFPWWLCHLRQNGRSLITANYDEAQHEGYLFVTHVHKILMAAIVRVTEKNGNTEVTRIRKAAEAARAFGLQINSLSEYQVIAQALGSLEGFKDYCGKMHCNFKGYRFDYYQNLVEFLRYNFKAQRWIRNLGATQARKLRQELGMFA